MTLIVGELTPQGPRLVSDTRITTPGAVHGGYKSGALKLIVLNRDLVVGFAGDRAIALDAVRAVHAEQLNGGVDVPRVIELLTAASAEGRRPAEFLVATGDSIARVRNGVSEVGLASAWIGDHDAFNRFQESRLTPDPPWSSLPGSVPEGAERMRVLQRSMQVVIDAPEVESVDDFCVSVAFTKGGFEYLGSLFVYVGREFIVDHNRDLLGQMAQGVEEGGFAVSVVEPASPGVPALGLSFPRARLGVLFLPLEFDDAQVLQDVGPNDFADVVRERFGVQMKPPPLVYG